MKVYDMIVLYGVILTFFASMFSIYISVKTNKTTQYIDKIVTSRIEWIDKLRKVIAEFSQKTYLNITIREEIDSEYYMRAIELFNRIHLLIGHKSDFEQNIIKTSKSLLQNLQHYMELKEQTDDVQLELNEAEELSRLMVLDLLYYSEIYFKYEWNRIKEEGKEYTSRLEKVNIESVTKEYGTVPPSKKENKKHNLEKENKD